MGALRLVCSAGRAAVDAATCSISGVSPDDTFVALLPRLTGLEHIGATLVSDADCAALAAALMGAPATLASVRLDMAASLHGGGPGTQRLFGGALARLPLEDLHLQMQHLPSGCFWSLDEPLRLPCATLEVRCRQEGFAAPHWTQPCCRGVRLCRATPGVQHRAAQAAHAPLDPPAPRRT